MNTQAEAVKKLKSLRSEFNCMNKLEGHGEESAFLYYICKVDTVISAIKSQDIDEAMSILRKLKESFDSSAAELEAPKQAFLQTLLRADYEHVSKVQQRFQNYSRAVADIRASI